MIKKIRVEDAIGEKLLHDLTGVKEGKKCTIFKRGHLITKADIEELVLNGKRNINVLDPTTKDVIHEEDAAKAFSNRYCGNNVIASNISEGKVNFISNVNGFVDIDEELVYKINCFSKISFATKKTGSYVKKGDTIASFRIVELFYDEKTFKEILEFNAKFISVEKISNTTVAVITIGSEIYNGLKKDLSFDAVSKKLSKFNIDIAKHYFCNDDELMLEQTITDAITNYDLVLCVGGMSVDADDVTAEVIEKISDTSIYGTPIMPGSVFMIANKNNKYILGLPANIMFSTYTAFDIFIPYVLMNKCITTKDVAKYGYGGLL